ncbi:MAG: lytic transglycosylase domain-containing protein, partial [Maribacter sp.]
MKLSSYHYMCLIGLMLLPFASTAQEKGAKKRATKVNKKSIELVKDSTTIDTLDTVEVVEMDIITKTTPEVFGLFRPAEASNYHLKDHALAAKFDSLWMKELVDAAPLFDEMYQEILEQDTLEVYQYDLPTDTLKARLALLNEKTPFNVEYNPSLESVIKSFLTRKRALMERMLVISQFYFPMFEQELDNNDIPLEMKYLSIVESALNPRARSRVGATGLWQFMYGTGREMKLDINSYVDERSDPLRSTKAACQYLNRLYSIYEDWDLALAAYNSGPGNVNKAIRRSGGQKNYWNIRR